MSTLSRAQSVTNKRKSVLSELGIKPGAEAPPKPNAKSTSVSSTLTRKTSTVSKSVSPSSSKASTTPSTRKSTVPATLKVDRSSTNGGNALKSPTTATPKPRSTTPNQKSSISPIGRKPSVNGGTSSTAAHKRLSTPSGLNSLMEVDSMKQQLADKDNEIERLREIESESELKISSLEVELEKLRAELQSSLEVNTGEESKGIENEERELIIKELEEKHKSETERLLKEKELEYNTEKDSLIKEHDKAIHQLKDSLLKEKEDQIESLKVSTSSNTEEKISTLRSEYESQIEKLKKTIETQTNELVEQKAAFEEHITKLKEQIQTLEDSQSISHLRKVQNELEASIAAFEEFKRSSQHETDILEKRYREEIKQLQNGNDDTAEAWLEKTRSAQQELNQLQDKMHIKDQEYKQAIQMLKDIHSEEEEKLHEICDEKEAQIEAQSHQIENLLYQVETLQNTLEAATVRLEHTAKSTPTTSSNIDDINNTASHSPVKNIHQECTVKIEAKQKEIDNLRASIAELKETHETQMNRLAQEKANKIQELKKKLSDLEEELATATPPLSPTKSAATGSSKVSIDLQLVEVAERHRNEMKKLQEQYQHEVDEKSRELEDYVYRVKALMTAKQKEVEKMRMETNNTVDKYEQDIKGYEATLIEYEKEVSKLKESCTAHLDENSQLVRLVHQLQSEIHR